MPMLTQPLLNCRTVERLLVDFFSTDCATEHRELVEEHLAGCQACRELAGGYRAVILLGRSLPSPPFPQALLQRLRRFVRKRHNHRPADDSAL
jgi:predicted anti-sigma-YlaC factor YlaD